MFDVSFSYNHYISRKHENAFIKEILKCYTLHTNVEQYAIQTSNRDETYTQESERKRERIARRLTRYLNKTSKIYVAAKEHFLVK